MVNPDIIEDLYRLQGPNRGYSEVAALIAALNRRTIPNPEDEADSKVTLYSPHDLIHDTELEPLTPPTWNEYFDHLHERGYHRIVPQTPAIYPLTESLTDTGLAFPTSFSSQKFAGGVTLNGSSYIHLANHSSLNVTDELALVGWLYIPAGITSGIIIKKDAQYELKISAANTLSFRIYSSGAWKTAITMTFTDATWFHFAATYKSTSSGQKLYKNGVLQSSDSETGAIATSSNVCGIFDDGAAGTILGNNCRAAWISALHEEVDATWIANHVLGILDTKNAAEIFTFPFTFNAVGEPDSQPGNFIPH